MSHRRRLLFLFLIAQLIAAAAEADTLRLSLPDAISRALSAGTQAELARSAQAADLALSYTKISAPLPRASPPGSPSGSDRT